MSFDAYADDYDRALEAGIAVSGEDKNYFARGRIEWLKRCLPSSHATGQVLDFGCGTGSATPFLLDILGASQVVGVDVSAKSIEVAARAFARRPARFCRVADYHPAADNDLAFCNGVFHHIPVDQRVEAASAVCRSLRPGGVFAFWENNPWNPGTRYVMSRIPFDEDAITLSSAEARRLLRIAGFEVLRTDFLFIFPGFLRRMRWMEPPLSRLPLGAQYQVLARVPHGSCQM